MFATRLSPALDGFPHVWLAVFVRMRFRKMLFMLTHIQKKTFLARELTATYHQQPKPSIICLISPMTCTAHLENLNEGPSKNSLRNRVLWCFDIGCFQIDLLIVFMSCSLDKWYIFLDLFRKSFHTSSFHFSLGFLSEQSCIKIGSGRCS